MKTIVLILVFLIGSVTLAHDIGREVQATEEVTAYVMDWTKNLPQRYWRRASRHIASVAHWSTRYNVDPLLVSVIISLESSWNVEARGKIGEVGLMQVHDEKAKKGFDLDNADEQIHAGVKYLRTCIESCSGDVKQGVNKYATGSCTKEWRMLDYRMRKYRKAVRLFRRTK